MDWYDVVGQKISLHVPGHIQRTVFARFVYICVCQFTTNAGQLWGIYRWTIRRRHAIEPGETVNKRYIDSGKTFVRKLSTLFSTRVTMCFPYTTNLSRMHSVTITRWTWNKWKSITVKWSNSEIRHILDIWLNMFPNDLACVRPVWIGKICWKFGINVHLPKPGICKNTFHGVRWVRTRMRINIYI